MTNRPLFFLIFLLLIVPLSSDAQKNKDYLPSDGSTLSPAPYAYQENRKYKGLKVHTGYIVMRDSVRIAYDLYLPKKWDGEKLPTLLHQTRYWRGPDLRWPFSMFSNGLLGTMGELVNEVVSQGYAVVNIDARGSGASFGSREYPWSPDETRDGAEIIDWIIEQEWSNGNVGSAGISYSGTTAEFLSFNQHPNLKAVLLMYSLYDVYDDIAYPGGIFQDFFVTNWGQFNGRLDRNKIPRGGFLVRLLVKGVRRVKTKQKIRTFRAALRDHESNRNVDETSRGIEFRDQVPDVPGLESIKQFSPFSYMDKINNSHTAVYSYSGWWDGDYQHANIRRHLNLTNPQNKLTIGPWEHGGKFNCSPENPGESGFDHIGEILKFFDYHLKGIETGIYAEPRVHYFTMAEERWKSSDQWPPASSPRAIYFSEDQSLSFTAPAATVKPVEYRVDTTAMTGDDSRWKSVIGMLETPQVYPDRKNQDEKLLCFTSQPLEANLEVSGHPLMKLYLQSDQPDGNFHVYLEEVSENRDVKLITEGLLRGIHRGVPDTEPLYKDVVPFRTYSTADTLAMNPDEVTGLLIDILPTSYLFRKGSRIRISLAGADQSHFKLMHKAVPTWQVHMSSAYPSHMLLPVVE